MTLPEPLRRAVLDAPDDVEARRAAAAWWHTHDEARAELVLLQCRGAQGDGETGDGCETGDTGGRAPSLRERRLLASHQPRWLAEVGLAPDEGALRLGFVESLTLSLRRARSLLGRLGRNSPVRCLRLVLTGRSDPGAVAEAVRRLPGLRRLDLAGNLLGDTWVVALSRLPSLGTVTRLDLAMNRLGEPALRALGAAPFATRLRHLRVDGNPLGAAGTRVLAGSTALSGLEVLGLSQTGLDDSSLPVLLEAPWVVSGGLRTLDLSGNRLGDPGATVLSRAVLLARLHALDLSGSDLEAPGLAALSHPEARPASSTAVSSSALRSLRLRCCRVGDDGTTALAGSPLAAGLEQLDLFQVGLGAAGIASLLERGTASRLRSLELGENYFGPEAAARLSAGSRRSAGARPRAARFERLAHLGLSGSALDDVGARRLARATFPALTSLELGDSQLSGDGLGALVAAGTLARLERLTLDRNPLGDGVMALLRADLPHLATLDLRQTYLGQGDRAVILAALVERLARGGPAELNLGTNDLDGAAVERLTGGPWASALTALDLDLNREVGDQGARAIARSSHLGPLSRLSLSICGIGDEGARALAESPRLQSLRELVLLYNPIGAEAARALRAAFGARVVVNH